MTKSLARMQIVLLQLRMKDLEQVDQRIRALHSAQIIQGNLLGVLAEFLKDRFAGDGADLEALGKTLLESQALSKRIIRLMEKETGPRDQSEAFIEDLNAIVERLPDD